MEAPRSGSMIMPRNPRLNFDILALILQFCSTGTDILALMYTCRDLYAAGIRPLVCLGLPLHMSKLENFLDFKFNHAPAVEDALQRLSFLVPATTDSFSEDDAWKVFDLLADQRNQLQVLEFNPRFGDIWVENCGFSGQFEALQDDYPVEILDSIELSPEERQEAAYEALILLLLGDPEYLGPEERQTFFSRAPQGAFSNLTVLKMGSTFFPLFSVLEAVCPRLEELGWDGEYTRFDTLVREENTDFWEQKTAPTRLRRITADFETLYQMALKHDLDVLSIHKGITTEDELCPVWFESDLSQLSFKSFNLTLFSDGGILLDVLRHTKLEGLSKMSLIYGYDDVDDPESAQDEVVWSLRDSGSKIQQLALDFRDDCGRTSRDIESFDIKTWPSRAKAALPTLTRFICRIERKNPFFNRIWISIIADYHDGEDVCYIVDSQPESLATAVRKALQE